MASHTEPSVEQVLELLSSIGALALDRGRNDGPPPVIAARHLPELSDRDTAVVDWIHILDPSWQPDDELVEQVLGGDGSGDVWQVWDAIAWYRQIHYYGERWGVCFDEEAMIRASTDIARTVGRIADPATTARECLAATYIAVFAHERFHHQLESAAIRTSIISRRSTYREYDDKVYQASNGPLEEGVAEAEARRSLERELRMARLAPTVQDATLRYVDDKIRNAPPGYSLANEILVGSNIGRARRDLVQQMLEASHGRRMEPWEVHQIPLNKGISGWKTSMLRPLFADEQIPRYRYTGHGIQPMLK